jgi:LmbE family N-acetylglucosaminyl deacetylase
MNPYQALVADFERLAREGKRCPLGGFPAAPRPALEANAPRVLIFSPHPDDECVIGALALRSLREGGMRVVNVAVTHGSNPARQAARLEELRAACAFLGFELVQTRPNGLERVNPRTRQQDRAAWEPMVAAIAGLLLEHQPRVILCPHERDWNSTHVGTHHLVMDALRQLGPASECFVVETEFWGQMDTPNLMVELSGPDLADMVSALSFHVGEVQRNPYHVLLPAWMLDNVRRGSELVGGQGQAAPDFIFATLYRLSRWRQGTLELPYQGGKQLPATVSPVSLFA